MGGLCDGLGYSSPPGSSSPANPVFVLISLQRPYFVLAIASTQDVVCPMQERAMRDPIRVLVIEDHKSDRFIAQQLLREYDLEFTWQRVSSEPELRAIAQEFKPSMVFCADELAMSSRHAALDMLRLLALRTVSIHVAEIGDMDGSRLCGDRKPVSPGVQTGLP